MRWLRISFRFAGALVLTLLAGLVILVFAVWGVLTQTVPESIKEAWTFAVDAER